MADMKQGHLNGAYYGPPVPPQQSHRNIGRGGSGLCCFPCCLISTLLKFIFSIVIFLGIIVLVLWLVLRPNEIKAYVDNATLTKFDLANNTSLKYNLALDMSIRNPNKKIGIYYDYIEAAAFYGGARFGYAMLPPFYQDHKTTSALQASFNGFTGGLGSDVNTTYTREKGEGDFYVDVQLYTELRLKIWIFKFHGFKPEIDCTVRLPVPGSSTAAPFQPTSCDVRYF